MKRSLFAVLSLLLLCSPASAAVLQQSTATLVTVWFYDPATGLGKTGLTVTSVGCEIIKSDQTAAFFNPTVSGGGTNDMIEVAHGAYKLELTATQLNTVGWFELGCEISGSTSPPTTYDILSAASYGTVVQGNVASIADFWAHATSGMTTVGSIGKLQVDNLDRAVSAVLGTSMAELAAVPSATPTAEEALMLLYMALRNKLTVTATQKSIYDDAGTLVVKKTLGSAGGTFTESEAVNGP